MSRFKVLITVKAYPLPSRSYDELVWTGCILEDGSWIRIYPVPFKFIAREKVLKKYQWIEIDLKRRSQKDFRPESYSPVKPDLSDVEIFGFIGTKNYWAERKKYCLQNVYYSLTKLFADAKAPLDCSLATFKPAKILNLIVEKDERNWKPVWVEQRKQLDMFADDKENKALLKAQMIRKLPYKFRYHIEDAEGKRSKMMIEDWEIGALYWNCLKDAKGNESVALKKVREKYFNQFTTQKDIYLFLGTTLQFHKRRVKNPFVIIGVFYPKKSPSTDQTTMNFKNL